MNISHPSVDDWEKRELRPNSGPAFVTVVSSGRCNLSCFMCGHSMLEEVPVRIDPVKIDPFLEKALIVTLAGGEPLWTSEKMNPVTHAIFNRMKKEHHHVKLGFLTNGVLLDKKMMQLAIERFTCIHFSVDTLDPAIYEKIRGKPLLDTVIKNIKNLNELKKEAGRGPQDPPFIDINTIVMNSTLDGLPALARKLAELGVRVHVLIRINHKIPYEYELALEEQCKENKINGRHTLEAKELLRIHREGIEKEFFSPEKIRKEQLEKIRDELKEIYSNSGIYVEDQVGIIGQSGGAKPLPPDDRKVCPDPWTRGHIQESGNVVCCCSNTTVIGNVARQDFDEIWKGPGAQALRESFIRGEMRGCVESACPSQFDYFTVTENSYLKNLLQNLRKMFKEQDNVVSILLLRTAPMRQSHLTARTLLKCFPNAKLTIVSNPQGTRDCMKWGVAEKVIAYPESFFRPEIFKQWWPSIKKETEYSLAAAIYTNEDRAGYEGVEEILHLIKAKRCIGIKPLETLINFH